MDILRQADNRADLRFSTDELIILSNAISELCYGVGISVSDLETRLGGSIEEIKGLLDQLLQVVDNGDAFGEIEIEIEIVWNKYISEILSENCNIPMSLEYETANIKAL